MENKIHVLVQKDNKGILKFPKCNIEAKAYIGENGITTDKKEGDRKTPIGEFELGIILGIHPDAKNVNGLKYKPITTEMYWVDDPESEYYNQLVDISQVEKDWNSAEHLIDYPIQYEYLIEIKTNPNNIPRKGSAIFLHCTNNNPTAGCIAVNKDILKKIIENVTKHTKIEISLK